MSKVIKHIALSNNHVLTVTIVITLGKSNYITFLTFPQNRVIGIKKQTKK